MAAVGTTGGPPVTPFQQLQYISVHVISMEGATSADGSGACTARCWPMSIGSTPSQCVWEGPYMGSAGSTRELK